MKKRNIVTKPNNASRAGNSGPYVCVVVNKTLPLSFQGATVMENLARDIFRASYSQERKTYLDHEAPVGYTAKAGMDQRIFSAMEWLAAMCSHISNSGEQMVIYCRYYSKIEYLFPKKGRSYSFGGIIRMRS